jgi:hypothetical protein
MNSSRFCVLSALAILAFAPSTSRGITLGQVDTFESGTHLGWTGGPFAGLGVQPGGLAGSSDHYIQVAPNNGSNGEQGDLSMGNVSQWTGDYGAAGVTAIGMDLRGQGTNLPIRISIVDNSGTGYSTTTAFSLPGDGQWHHAVFSLAANDLTAISSPQPLPLVLGNVGALHILSSSSPSLSGGDFYGLGVEVDVDNIAAVPEPASISILLSGIVGIALLHRRRARPSS